MNRKLFDSLNEKRQRLYLGELAAEYGASRERVSKGMRERNAGESYRQGEAVRRAGGGRKKKPEIYPNLEGRIAELVEANDGTYGAPTDDRKWTAFSQRKLSRMLKEEGMDVSAGTVASILKKSRYSRQQNRKMKEASERGPHRDEQFEIISRKTEEFEKAGEPVVSIDSKKKKSSGILRLPGFFNRSRHALRTLRHPQSQGLCKPYSQRGHFRVCRGKSEKMAEFARQTGCQKAFAYR